MTSFPRAKILAPLGLVAAAGSACLSGGELLEGLALRNPNDTGPVMIWDLLARPLPEIPFPNDVATRPDADSPTGLRINVSEQAPTEHERTLRRLIATLDGFGTYAPITIRFDGLIDLADLSERQNNSGADDDAIYLVNLEPTSTNYGQMAPLDVGGGHFPVTLQESANYFANDPQAEAGNLLFSTAADGNKRPNVWSEVLSDGRDDPYRDLITFYELETNTLVIRPLVPLEEASRYAVVLTRRVRGAETHSPIRSPFAYVNHLEQTEALRRLVDDAILHQLGLEPEDIAFTWSFTTQSITRDLETIRAGLYGTGPMAYLRERFPAVLSAVPQVDAPDRTDNVYVVRSARLIEILSDPAIVSGLGVDPEDAEALIEGYRDNIAYAIAVRFESPGFLENDTGTFHVDAIHGSAEYVRDTISMLCVVPNETPGHTQPFSVAFYNHGYTSSRLEMLGFGASLGRFGLATCAIDAYGHGLPLNDLTRVLIEQLFAQHGLGRFAEETLEGRARDLNGDGTLDSGGDFWTANTFHTRDVVRQTAVDQIEAIRVLRGFGIGTMPVDIQGDGTLELNGDFDGDGVADFGGPGPYYEFGISLGGIVSGLVGSAEPAISAAAPISGGGGLADVAARSSQRGVVQAVFLPLMGPLVVGRASSTVPGGIDVAFDVLDVNREVFRRFAQAPAEALSLGDRLRLVNELNGESDEVSLAQPTGSDPVGLFRLQIAADVGDRLRLELYRAGASEPYRIIRTFETHDLDSTPFYGQTHPAGSSLVALQEGFGYRRGTPPMRRLFGLAQMVVDPGDPVNYAPLYRRPSPMRPDGGAPTNLLVVNTVGDMNVPINTGIAFARAAGAVEFRTPDPRYGKSEDALLVDSWVVEGLEKLRRFETNPCHYDPREVLFDIDEASQGRDPEEGPHPSLVVRPPANLCDGTPGQPGWCEASCASQAPLRATHNEAGAVLGMRVLYVSPMGGHGINVPQPSRPFDYNRYQINQIGWFFATGGREIVDDVCLATDTCSFY